MAVDFHSLVSEKYREMFPEYDMGLPMHQVRLFHFVA